MNPIVMNAGDQVRFLDFVSMLPEYMSNENDVVSLMNLFSDYINNAYRDTYTNHGLTFGLIASKPDVDRAVREVSQFAEKARQNIGSRSYIFRDPMANPVNPLEQCVEYIWNGGIESDDRRTGDYRGWCLLVGSPGKISDISTRSERIIARIPDGDAPLVQVVTALLSGRTMRTGDVISVMKEEWIHDGSISFKVSDVGKVGVFSADNAVYAYVNITVSDRKYEPAEIHPAHLDGVGYSFANVVPKLAGVIDVDGLEGAVGAVFDISFRATVQERGSVLRIDPVIARYNASTGVYTLDYGSCNVLGGTELKYIYNGVVRSATATNIIGSTFKLIGVSAPLISVIPDISLLGSTSVGSGNLVSKFQIMSIIGYGIDGRTSDLSSAASYGLRIAKPQNKIRLESNQAGVVVIKLDGIQVQLPLNEVYVTGLSKVSGAENPYSSTGVYTLSAAKDLLPVGGVFECYLHSANILMDHAGVRVPLGSRYVSYKVQHPYLSIAVISGGRRLVVGDGSVGDYVAWDIGNGWFSERLDSGNVPKFNYIVDYANRPGKSQLSADISLHKNSYITALNCVDISGLSFSTSLHVLSTPRNMLIAVDESGGSSVTSGSPIFVFEDVYSKILTSRYKGAFSPRRQYEPGDMVAASVGGKSGIYAFTRPSVGNISFSDITSYASKVNQSHAFLNSISHDVSTRLLKGDYIVQGVVVDGNTLSLPSTAPAMSDAGGIYLKALEGYSFPEGSWTYINASVGKKIRLDWSSSYMASILSPGMSVEVIFEPKYGAVCVSTGSDRSVSVPVDWYSDPIALSTDVERMGWIKMWNIGNAVIPASLYVNANLYSGSLGSLSARTVGGEYVPVYYGYEVDITNSYDVAGSVNYAIGDYIQTLPFYRVETDMALANMGARYYSTDGDLVELIRSGAKVFKAKAYAGATTADILVRLTGWKIDGNVVVFSVDRPAGMDGIRDVVSIPPARVFSVERIVADAVESYDGTVNYVNYLRKGDLAKVRPTNGISVIELSDSAITVDALSLVELNLERRYVLGATVHGKYDYKNDIGAHVISHESDVSENRSFEYVADRNLPFVEKIHRLALLKDASVADFGMLSALARFMGYDMSGLLDSAIGNSTLVSDFEAEIRAVVKSIPEYNRTRNSLTAVQSIMSVFGITGKLVSKWTNGSSFYRDMLDTSEVPGRDGYVPTLHFKVLADVGDISPVVDFDEISRAIRSSKPVDTVFDGIVAHMDHIIKSNAGPVSFVNKAVIAVDIDVS